LPPFYGFAGAGIPTKDGFWFRTLSNKLFEMAILSAPASMDDFQKTNWIGVMSSSPRKLCEDYSTVFCILANKAFEAGNTSTFELLRLLAFVSLLRLRPEDRINPLRSFDPHLTLDFLGDHDFDFLAQLQRGVEDAELKSRITDILYLQRRDVQAGIIAIGAYVTAAQQLSFEDGFYAVHRFERAARLALTLNQKDQQDHLRTILSQILLSPDHNPSFVTSDLSLVLTMLKYQENEVAATSLVRLSGKAERSGNRLLQRRLLDLAGDWYRAADRDDDGRKMFIKAAETFVDEAAQLASTPNMSFGQPAMLVEQAISAFRKIGGQQARIEQILQLLSEYQQKFIVQMVPLSEKVNFDASAAAAKSHVNRPSIHEAILALVYITASPKVGRLIEEVREAGKYLGRSLFGTTILGPTGKTAAKQPPVREGDDQSTGSFRSEMYRNAAIHRQSVVMGLIEPARAHIIEQHYIRYRDIAEIVWQSPIVPNGRQQIWTEGLIAGFEGNFMVASHLLVPQIEHLIRVILTSAGHRTSAYDSDGIQDEHDLNATLRHPELPKLLGEDLVFDLRGLLVERFGSNIRNELAHGMRSYSGFYMADSAYCWWISLRLICVTSGTGLYESHPSSPAPPPSDS
jgi:hypothetical protein